MVRKQIYITDEQEKALVAHSEQMNRSQSDLIREAIDEILAKHEQERRARTLRATAGLWEDRTDLPDWRTLREEGDERLDRWSGGDDAAS